MSGKVQWDDPGKHCLYVVVHTLLTSWRGHLWITDMDEALDCLEMPL